MREEVEDDLLRRRGTLAQNFDPYGFDVAGWRTLNLWTYLRRYPQNCARLPRTARILAAVPRLTSAYVNLLEPHTRIPAHYGDSNTIQRCHVGIVVPGDVDACGLQVGTERRGWREGGALVFCDAHEHFAWNDTDRPRVILVFDVMRPEYWPERRRICARVLAAIALTWADTKTGLVFRLPRRVLRGLHATLGLAARALLGSEPSGAEALVAAPRDAGPTTR